MLSRRSFLCLTDESGFLVVSHLISTIAPHETRAFWADLGAEEGDAGVEATFEHPYLVLKSEFFRIERRMRWVRFRA